MEIRRITKEAARDIFEWYDEGVEGIRIINNYNDDYTDTFDIELDPEPIDMVRPRPGFVIIVYAHRSTAIPYDSYLNMIIR